MTLQTMADELAAHRFFRLIPADLRVLLQSRPVADAPFVLAKRF